MSERKIEGQTKRQRRRRRRRWRVYGSELAMKMKANIQIDGFKFHDFECELFVFQLKNICARQRIPSNHMCMLAIR